MRRKASDQESGGPHPYHSPPQSLSATFHVHLRSTLHANLIVLLAAEQKKRRRRRSQPWHRPRGAGLAALPSPILCRIWSPSSSAIPIPTLTVAGSGFSATISCRSSWKITSIFLGIIVLNGRSVMPSSASSLGTTKP